MKAQSVLAHANWPSIGMVVLTLAGPTVLAFGALDTLQWLLGGEFWLPVRTARPLYGIATAVTIVRELLMPQRAVRARGEFDAGP